MARWGFLHGDEESHQEAPRGVLHSYLTVTAPAAQPPAPCLAPARLLLCRHRSRNSPFGHRRRGVELYWRQTDVAWFACHPDHAEELASA